MIGADSLAKVHNQTQTTSSKHMGGVGGHACQALQTTGVVVSHHGCVSQRADILFTVCVQGREAGDHKRQAISTKRMLEERREL